MNSSSSNSFHQSHGMKVDDYSYRISPQSRETQIDQFNCNTNVSFFRVSHRASKHGFKFLIFSNSGSSLVLESGNLALQVWYDSLV